LVDCQAIEFGSSQDPELIWEASTKQPHISTRVKPDISTWGPHVPPSRLDACLAP
jgi:hypothetical protein